MQITGRPLRVGVPALAALVITSLVAACGPGTPPQKASSTKRPATTSSSATPKPAGSSRSSGQVAAAAAPSARPVVASTAPAANACAANRRGQQVRVSLKAQHMWFCQGDRAVFDTAITSGIPSPDTRTPTGNYRIQGLNRNSTLTLNTGRTYDVKYWIPFNAPLFGFHDSPWQKFPYGSAQYKTDGSHGCVHMPLTAIKRLYKWADIGTRVHIGAT